MWSPTPTEVPPVITAAPASARPVAPARVLRSVRRETALFLLAVAAIALQVIDDNFLQPQPGTSARDHLASGLVPLAALGASAWAYPRLSGLWRGALALFLASVRDRRRRRRRVLHPRARPVLR